MKSLLVSRKLRALLVCAALLAAAGIGATALISPVEAGPCICPKIYAPVQCDNGKTYPNQCVADCRHARNCVPTGEL